MTCSTFIPIRWFGSVFIYQITPYDTGELRPTCDFECIAVTHRRLSRGIALCVVDLAWRGPGELRPWYLWITIENLAMRQWRSFELTVTGRFGRLCSVSARGHEFVAAGSK